MYPTLTILLVSLPSLVLSTPLTTIIPRLSPPFAYKQLTITLIGGPASESFPLPADGNTYPVSSSLSVSLITAAAPSADIGIYYFCNFIFASGSLQFGTGPRLVAEDGGRSVQVGAPQPIISVNCQPTPGGEATCLDVYASCQWCGGGLGGCETLNCCSGYCAGTKCRATTNPQQTP